MESVFITGGAGFIGRHLCRRLLKDNNKIIIFDNFSSSSRRDFLEEFSGSVEILEGDITEKESIVSGIGSVKPEAVVHLAACVSVQKSLENPQKTHQVNVDGTKNVLEASIKAGIKKFVFASSAAVYGDLEPPLTEDLVFLDNAEFKKKLLSPYAVSKLEGEELIMKSGLISTIFRIFNVYGPGQKNSGGYAAVIPEFLNRILNNENLMIYGNGDQTRDFINIKDVVEVFSLSIKSFDKKGIFNLASGNETSLKDLIAVLKKLFPDSFTDVRYENIRKGDIQKSFADITRLKKFFNFKPSVSLFMGIEDMMTALS